MKQFGVGLIGLGSIALRMLEGFASHNRFTPCLAWDPAQRARAAALEAYPDLTIAPDAQALLDSPDVDIVYLACPPHTHRAHAMAAIDARKALLCEKPLGVDVADSSSLVDAAERSGLSNGVNLLYANAGAAVEIERALHTQKLGDVHWVDIHLHLPGWAKRRYAEAPWLMQRNQGGFIREVTTHYVFLCQRLFGALSLDSCYIEFPTDETSAETFADVRLSAGATTITITGTTQGHGPEVNHVTFWGARAAYRIRDLHELDRSDGDIWTSILSPRVRPELDTYLRQLDGLADMLDHKEHRIPDFREAYETQLLIEKILANNADGR